MASVAIAATASTIPENRVRSAFAQNQATGISDHDADQVADGRGE